jgi:transposase-like protein
VSYFPSLLEPRRRAERALLAVVQEAYALGVSTRRVEDLVEALGIASISRSEVSRICAALDAEVETFRSRVSSPISRSLRPTAGQIRSTNPLERLNKEIKRRTAVVGIVPTRASLIRLVGMVLAEQDGEWQDGRRHFSHPCARSRSARHEERRAHLCSLPSCRGT